MKIWTVLLAEKQWIQAYKLCKQMTLRVLTNRELRYWKPSLDTGEAPRIVKRFANDYFWNKTSEHDGDGGI